MDEKVKMIEAVAEVMAATRGMIEGGGLVYLQEAAGIVDRYYERGSMAEMLNAATDAVPIKWYEEKLTA